MLRGVLGASLIVFTSCAAFGQSAAAPAFMAAVSVKPVKPDFAALKGAPQAVISISPGSVTMKNVTLKDVIIAAYGVKDYQISGALLNSGWYDILGKADAAASPDRLKLLLQGLLADRFKVALHRDTRELAMYALVVGKEEPKLHAGSRMARAVRILPEARWRSGIIPCRSWPTFSRRTPRTTL